MQLYTIIAIGGAAAGGVAILVMFLSLQQYSSEEYALDVDAFRDQADLIGFSRVILTNTGHSTLTNIVIDFGDHRETLPKLTPGQKIMVSPKDGTEPDHVTVTADNGIHITKEFRSAPKAPGMIGGMG
ncbi:MAG: hypothetical protein ACRD5H_15540 [Nitrososphaerales archaeon]